ncbi:hypothetical protein GSI_07340 [Ganoderma sinense ZZ0214-1]|uniref:Uncharacterized protein n=1 Tax=Ganoderma sinense ZZ0214-1 TaxID=1077348 RepID=A0A2G8SAL0_9APHY|nr:hypothetical protein GSI_07340 [Ganoderma sinense ZZ0214-1]
MDPLLNIPRLSELSGHLQQLPTTDRGAFSTLTSIPDIQAWAVAKADEYRQFALALLAIHNLAAPIHRLPTEVLERVFSNCWQDWNSLRLPHVCRLWRSILLDRPEFWADAVAKCELQEKREIVRNELPLIDSLLSRSTQYSHTINPNFYIFPPAIAQLVTPRSSSVASLNVTVGKIDLQDGLWPALVSGMQNLETLTIQLAITEADVSQYRRMINADFMQHYHSPAWSKLPMLSRDALPNLSRLTCPHGMVGRFANVPLRHLKAQVQVMKRSQSSQVECYLPTVVLGRPQGLHLKPHRRRLETLEIMPIGHVSGESEEPSESLEFVSLRHLRIKADRDVASYILSWLQLSQAAFVHITRFYTSSHGTNLRSVVDTIDRVCLQHLDRDSLAGSHAYRMQCFAGGIERLRIDNLSVDSRTLASVFGNNAPVTHLELSVLDSNWVMDRFDDLHAFPHLVHLDMSGLDVHAMGILLKPALHPQRQLGPEWGFPDPETSPLPSLKLTELVISCPPPDFRYTRRLNTDTKLDTEVDEHFRKEFGVFQRALTDRAARGTRLTYLALALRPAILPGSKAGAKEIEAGAGQRQQQQAPLHEEAGSGVGSDNNPGGSSNETVGHKEPALKSCQCAFWPSHAARKSALESLRELVDGPVILKLLDDAGDEISVEEA